MSALGVNIAILRGREVLLTKRDDFPVWCLPGGGVEDGETLAEAAAREAEEETGLRVTLTRLVGVYSRPHWLEGGDHLVLFAAEPVGGQLRLCPGETTDVAFFARAALPAALLGWHHQQVADAFSGVVGVARRQDVAWPLAGKTRADVYRLRDQGLLSASEFIAAVCGPPRPEHERLEVPGGALPVITAAQPPEDLG